MLAPGGKVRSESAGRVTEYNSGIFEMQALMGYA